MAPHEIEHAENDAVCRPGHHCVDYDEVCAIDESHADHSPYCCVCKVNFEDEPEETEAVDLVGALRKSVEAAKERREERARQEAALSLADERVGLEGERESFEAERAHASVEPEPAWAILSTNHDLPCDGCQQAAVEAARKAVDVGVWAYPGFSSDLHHSAVVKRVVGTLRLS